MAHIKVEEAHQTAVQNRGQWNMKTVKFFAMGLTAAGIAQICPDGLAPIMVASSLSLAGAMLSSAYMAHQNQKVINDLEEKPFHKVQTLIENVGNLSVESTIANISKSIKAIRENNKKDNMINKAYDISDSVSLNTIKLLEEKSSINTTTKGMKI
jgi:hypothetical protein